MSSRENDMKPIDEACTCRTRGALHHDSHTRTTSSLSKCKRLLMALTLPLVLVLVLELVLLLVVGVDAQNACVFKG
jgi:hypothetical protein